MSEPRDFQIRIEYLLDGKRYLEDFWTTEENVMALIRCWPNSSEFGRALRKLNPQLRYRQGYPARDWAHEVKPEDILGFPELVGIKESLRPGQDRLFGKGPVGKKAKYFRAPLGLPEKEPPRPKQEEKLFEDY